MAKSKKSGKKKKNKISRTGLPILDSDQDFLSVFGRDGTPGEEMASKPPAEKISKNKHGVQILDETVPQKHEETAEEDEDFETLLDQYYKNQQGRSFKKPDPVPLKKRLKRYPPVETELDLHGSRASEAQLKVRSFIQTCKHQGFFTIRIIVGKGLHSADGPVLPDVVEDVVRKMTAEGTVLWHEWDRKRKSKSGAMIIYLKQFDRFD